MKKQQRQTASKKKKGKGGSETCYIRIYFWTDVFEKKFFLKVPSFLYMYREGERELFIKLMFQFITLPSQMKLHIQLPQKSFS